MKPKGVAIAVLSQYGVMPLTAFCLAKVGIPGFKIKLYFHCINSIINIRSAAGITSRHYYQ